jgi:hypothetical protein
MLVGAQLGLAKAPRVMSRREAALVDPIIPPARKGSLFGPKLSDSDRRHLAAATAKRQCRCARNLAIQARQA